MSCSFWWENHRMHDIDIRKLSLLRISHESTSSTTSQSCWRLMNHQLHNAQTYIKAVQKLSQSVHFCSLSQHSESAVDVIQWETADNAFLHKAAIRNQKDLVKLSRSLNKQDSLITLTAAEEQPSHTWHYEAEKDFDDSHSRNTSGWAFSSIDWRLSEQTSLRQWDNINVTSSSSFFCLSKAECNLLPLSRKRPLLKWLHKVNEQLK
jgi:hypothetical protein